MSVYEVTGLRVIIAGGGTAGHINPGIAIARYIKEKDKESEILFIGTNKGMEAQLVPREGFEIKFIKVRGFRRKLSKENLTAIKELIQGIAGSKKIIKEFKPDVVIGTGGYVCGPVVFSASRMKIPTLIHEQNAFPGITNRILSRYVDAVAVSFRESEEYFKSAKKLVNTGNPVRPELFNIDRQTARQKLGIDRQKPLVVVMGGSLGAEKINETVVAMLKKYFKNNEISMIFSTGARQHDKVIQNLGDYKNPSVNVVPYIYDSATVYNAADLIICRAGAITCSELTALGIPAIIIPSPNVVANHQEYNARALEKHGAAVVIIEKDLNVDLLYRQITDLLGDKEQLAKMARNSKKIGIVNSTEKIYSIIKEITA